jgi:hypothetical protein
MPLWIFWIYGVRWLDTALDLLDWGERLPRGGSIQTTKAALGRRTPHIQSMRPSALDFLDLWSAVAGHRFGSLD